MLSTIFTIIGAVVVFNISTFLICCALQQLFIADLERSSARSFRDAFDMNLRRRRPQAKRLPRP